MADGEIIPARWAAWWQKLRRSDTTRYFVGKSAFLLPLNILGQLIGFVSTILYARFLTPETYGQFSFVYSTVQVLSFLALSGVTTAMAQAAALNQDGFFRRGTAARLRWSAIGSAVIAVVAVVTWSSKGPAVGMMFALAAGLFPLFYALDGYWSILTGKKRFETIAVMRLIQMCSVAVTTWLAVVVTRRVEWVFLASFGVTAVTNAVFYGWTMRRFCKNDDSAPGLLGYGQRLSGLGVLTAIEARVDHVLLGALLPFQHLGWFNMGDRISDAVIKGTWSVTSQMLFPRLAETTEAEARRRARVWGWYLMGGYVVLGVLFWLVAAPILQWVLGPAHHESVRLANWLVLIAVASVPWSICEVYFQARTAERALWVSRLTVTGLHLATLPWFLSWWGVTGVLLSMAVSRVACVLVCFWLFGQRGRAVGGEVK